MLATLSLITILSVSPSSAFTVQKCCPQGEALDQGSCNKTDNFPGSKWFPFNALYNWTKNEPMTDEEQKQVRGWLEEPGGFSLSNHTHFSPSRTLLMNTEEVTLNFRIMVASKNDLAILINVHSDHNFTHDPDDNESILEMDEVCIDRIGPAKLFAVVFNPSKIFMRKCCPHSYVFNIFNHNCTPDEMGVHVDSWRPNGHGADLHDVLVRPNLSPSEWLNADNQFDQARQYETYECRGFLDGLIFLKNGSVVIDGEVHSDYCLDVTKDKNGRHSTHNVVYYFNSNDDEQTEENTIETTIDLNQTYGYLFIVGGVFMLVTVAISLCLPRLRYQLHNKIAITHNAILMIVHFAWGRRLLFDDDNVQSEGCTLKVLIIQFTFLASLSWLNVFCLDVSSTFRTTRGARDRSSKSEIKRYMIYSIYAWGLPAIITIFTVTMEHAEKPLIARPGLTCYCQFAPNNIMSQLIYMYGPMAFLLSINLTLYIFTTWKIIGVHRQTARVFRRQDSATTGGFSSQTDKEKLAIYTKLFFIMGITWALYIINWILGNKQGIFAEIVNFINILRPVFIFVIFICKRWVFIGIRDKILLAAGRDTSNRSTVTEHVSLADWRSSGRKSSRQSSIHMMGPINSERKRSQAQASIHGT